MLLMAHVDSHNSNREAVWFLDSGCSNHMTGNKQWFLHLDQTFKQAMRLANDAKMMVMGKGSIILQVNGANMVITDVFYIPELTNNLLSNGQTVMSPGSPGSGNGPNVQDHKRLEHHTLQEKLHFATFKIVDCGCSKGRNCTFATVSQQARMLGSQLSFATLHRTVAPTAAKGTATLQNCRKVGGLI